MRHEWSPHKQWRVSTLTLSDLRDAFVLLFLASVLASAKQRSFPIVSILAAISACKLNTMLIFIDSRFDSARG